MISGGSTLTMQAARLAGAARGAHARRQTARRWRARIELEQRFSKNEILDIYLALAPYGGNLEGLRAASVAYFGKEPRRLTTAEQAAARGAAAIAGSAPAGSQSESRARGARPRARSCGAAWRHHGGGGDRG